MPIHPTAIVDPKAQVDPLAEIGPYSVIGADVMIGVAPFAQQGAHNRGAESGSSQIRLLTNVMDTPTIFHLVATVLIFLYSGLT